jgi:hypothetical protein
LKVSRLEPRAMFLENARTIPLLLAAPPAPGISCTDLGQIRVRVAVAKGELTRPFYRILADTASRCIHGAHLVVVPGGRHAAPALTPATFKQHEDQVSWGLETTP